MKKAKTVAAAVLALAALAQAPAQQLQYDFRDWVAAHLEYPQAAYERMYEASVPVNFKVAADGTIFDVECRADLRRESDMILRMVDSAVAAVASAPKWSPADGDHRSEDYSLMVEFEMPKFGAEMERAPGFMRPEGVGEEYHRSHEKLRDWIASQISVPADFRISMTGIVEKGGTLGHIKVVSSSDDTVAAKVPELLERAPKWSPGIGRDGNPVRAFRYIPLRFGGANNDPLYASAERGGERMPAFEGGGLDRFRSWVMMSLEYPENLLNQNIRGTVLLRFVVDRQGRVVDIETLHSPNAALAREVARVVGRSPRWTPGVNTDGEPTDVYYLLPVVFSIPK